MLNKRLYAKTPISVIPVKILTEKRKALSKLWKVTKEKSKQQYYFNYESSMRIISCETIDDGNHKVLVLYIYQVKATKDFPARSTPYYRIFLTEDDYITQDLNAKKIHWLTAGIDWIVSWYAWYGINFTDEFFATEKDKKIFCSFLKAYAKKEDATKYERVRHFQEMVREKRLIKKYKTITDPIDKKMEEIVPVPNDFEEWIETTGMASSRYVIYKKANAKKKSKAFCTFCKSEFEIDRGKTEVQNCRPGICPKCGSKIIYRVNTRLPDTLYDDRYMTLVQKNGTGFVVRNFHVTWLYHKDTGFKVIEKHMEEVSRKFFTFDNAKKKPDVDLYEYTLFKNKFYRWNVSQGYINVENSVLYDRNLPQEWENTPMKYSALEILSRNNIGIPFDYNTAIRTYTECPKFYEYTIKMGFNQLVKECLNEYYWNSDSWINRKADTIYGMLRLDKDHVRLAQKMNASREMIRLLQYKQRAKLNLSEEDLKRFLIIFGLNEDLIKSRKTSIHKIIRYVEKEGSNYRVEKETPCHNGYYYVPHNRIDKEQTAQDQRLQAFANDWIDYLSWCKDLHINLNSMFNYMPTNFKAVHDRIYKEYQAMKDQIAKERKRREEEAAKKELQETERLLKEMLNDCKCDGTDFLLESKGLVMMLPKEANDLKKEGETLHHCVYTYLEKVTSGKTTILFIRTEEHPDKSYFTMEYRDGNIIQCRGMNNCDPPAPVKAFIKLFDRKYKEAQIKPERLKVSA